jgi:hypothetical protein
VILPWFGGSSAVWSTCMLFVQMTLLLGYLYAHWLHEVRAGKQQAIVHTVMLAASLIALPILPYFMLSLTSPLLQACCAQRNRGIPYRLFALSNLASMISRP